MNLSTKPAVPVDYDLYIENCVWQRVESAFVVRFPSRTYYMNHLVCFTFNIIQALLTIILNYLAVHALGKSSQLRRKTTLFLVLLLSFNDLVIGVMADPVLLFHLGREIYGMENCFGSTLKKITLDTLSGISITIFVVFNAEIYLSIVYPIFHKTNVTNKRILKIVCILGIISILRAYLFVFHISKRVTKLFATAFLLLALIALAFIHIKISLIAYKRRRFGFAAAFAGRQRKSFLHGIREAKTCLLVLFCTVLCYLPSVIEEGMTERSTQVVILFNPWRNTSALASAVLNSIVFFWRNGILRKEAKNIIQSLSGIFVHTNRIMSL